MTTHAFAGEYRFRVLRADRAVRLETDWMPNLITNVGLDQVGVGALGTYCRIGTGTAAPAFTDKQLVSQAAATSNIVAKSLVNAGAPNYENLLTTTYEFTQSAVVGNMAEIGVGWAASGDSLFSRARIVDSEGAPTSISVLAGEILQVVYRLSLYPALDDVTGTVLIGGESYDYVARASQAGGGIGAVSMASPLLADIYEARAYNGTIGATTGTPSGSSAVLDKGTGALLPYTPGSYCRDYVVSAGIGGANLVGGIKSVQVQLGTGNGTTIAWKSQIQFAPAIPKDATKQFSLTLRQSWGRR